jgi:hypothetical protein
MKRKPLLLTACLALAGAAFLGAASPAQAKAATFVDKAATFTDDFANGVSKDNYTTVGDSDGKYSFINKPGQLTFGGFDYNSGYAITKDPVTVAAGKSLVVQYDVISDAITGGYLCLWKGATAYSGAWSATMPMFLARGTISLSLRAKARMARRRNGSLPVLIARIRLGSSSSTRMDLSSFLAARLAEL